MNTTWGLGDVKVGSKDGGGVFSVMASLGSELSSGISSKMSSG